MTYVHSYVCTYVQLCNIGVWFCIIWAYMRVLLKYAYAILRIRNLIVLKFVFTEPLANVKFCVKLHQMTVHIAYKVILLQSIIIPTYIRTLADTVNVVQSLCETIFVFTLPRLMSCSKQVRIPVCVDLF